MESKIDSIDKNQTWELVQLPKGKNALLCKWVYKLKSQVTMPTKVQGSIGG